MLTWTVYFLAKQETIQGKLVAELETHLPELNGVSPTDVEQLAYDRREFLTSYLLILKFFSFLKIFKKFKNQKKKFSFLKFF